VRPSALAARIAVVAEHPLRVDLRRSSPVGTGSTCCSVQIAPVDLDSPILGQLAPTHHHLGPREQVAEQFERLGDKLLVENGEPREVAAWPRTAFTRAASCMSRIVGPVCGKLGLTSRAIHRGWRSDQLWLQPYGDPSRDRHLRRKNSQRRQAGRSAGSAADHIRAGSQPQDRPCFRRSAIQNGTVLVFLALAFVD
jgi:hypothetical protein